jgi:hypothetical protein
MIFVSDTDDVNFNIKPTFAQNDKFKNKIVTQLLDPFMRDSHGKEIKVKTK